jgi:hypothetical protein
MRGREGGGERGREEGREGRRDEIRKGGEVEKRERCTKKIHVHMDVPWPLLTREVEAAV